MDWKNIVNLKKLALDPGKLDKPYEHEYSRPATQMGAKKLGFNVSTLPPGQFTCPYHFHHCEEELFLILEGKALLRQANQYREVSEGDLIFFTTGPEGAHQLYNHTETTCKILAISTMAEIEIAEYPDSKKLNVSKLRKIFQRGTEVDYFKDEQNPAQYWPENLVKGK